MLSGGVGGSAKDKGRTGSGFTSEEKNILNKLNSLTRWDENDDTTENNFNTCWRMVLKNGVNLLEGSGTKETVYFKDIYLLPLGPK